MKSDRPTLAIGSAILILCASAATAVPSEGAPPVHCLNKVHTIAEGGITNTYAYDSEGRVISITGSNGRTSTFTWNTEGEPGTMIRDEWLAGQPISSTTFTLGKHDLAETDDAGTRYEYDAHRFLVREANTNFVETRTIEGGNIVQVTRTGEVSFTITNAYTAIENCLEAGFHLFGRAPRNWPAMTIQFRTTGAPVYITYSYGFDELGRVVSRTDTITIDSATSERTTHFTYE